MLGKDRKNKRKSKEILDQIKQGHLKKEGLERWGSESANRVCNQ